MSTGTHSWKRTVSDETSRLLPETRIRRQVDGIEYLLDLKYRSRVLDLGCGSGGQTLELARRRFRVVGMDVSPKALSTARQDGRDQELTVHFVALDMRRLPYEEEFNAVVNVRNPIGCYSKEKDDLECLKAAAQALKPGGKLFLDLLNREWVIRRLTQKAGDGPPFDIKTGRLDCASFRPRGQRPDNVGKTMRLYSLTESMRMVKEAGFTFRKVFGGYDGRSYGVDSLRMIIVAEKTRRPKKPARKTDADGFERALRIKGRPR
jgi:SAM-dependent methyltransferase